MTASEGWEQEMTACKSREGWEYGKQLVKVQKASRSIEGWKQDITAIVEVCTEGWEYDMAAYRSA